MYNVIFLSIDKINDDFQVSKEELEQISILIDNIKKVSPEVINSIILTSNHDYNEINYKLHLLQAYLMTLHVNDSSVVMGPSFTNDRTLHGFFTLDDNRRLDVKMSSLIKDMEANNSSIENIISINRGLEFGLLDNTTNYKHIVLTEDFEDAKSPIDIDTEFGKDITYLVSPKKGLNGYNECFDTYFEHKNIIKLTNK